ncbi:MAG: aspartate 1-decarboxylase [bacterium]|nr:aspartate 1-decarboxylase [bacterium]
MLMRTFLRAKIHRATVTAADLDYVGSVSIDADLMDAADLDHLEQVEIYDITNGARLTTYALRGPRGSGEVQINGAAAHLVAPGDLVIICAFAQIDRSELADFRARIVLVNEDNRISEVRRPGLADSAE